MRGSDALFRRPAGRRDADPCGLQVDAAEAEDFARRYDPEYIPPSGVGWIHRGPRISPWQAAALSWKLLSDLAAPEPLAEAAFSRPGDVQWRFEVSVGDLSRIEVEVVELLAASAGMREHGLARVKFLLSRQGRGGSQVGVMTTRNWSMTLRSPILLC